MGKETYYELTKRSIPIIKNEAVFLSWRNSVVTIRTSKRVNFLEYSYNIECLEKNLDFLESSILSPKDSPATELCNCKFWKSEMRNVDYTEMIVNSAFWPHNPSLTQEMTSVCMCKWSPPNFIKSDCVLAILNNIGGVEIFAQQQWQWKSMLNLSPYINKALQYNKSPKCFEELKESIYIVETSAICWARELNPDNSCYFVTAQINGTILFWKIFANMNTVKVLGSIETEMAEITRMKWIPKSENRFYLICSDIMGQINGFDLQVENEKINILQPFTLWPHKDRMMPVSLNYTEINNHLVFICSKHRHLLIQVLDKNCTVIAQYLNNINDHRITDIAYTTDGFYLSTVNVKVYKINIAFEDDKLSVDLIQLDIKEPYTSYELHGLRFSTNNKICALAMADRRILCRKEAHKVEVIFITNDSKMESILPTLLNNPTKKLTDYWDCVEILRFQISKLKILPKLDYDELYSEACSDVYKLKIYLILLVYISGLRKVLRVCTLTLPETSEELVKEKILYLHAKTLLNNLYNKCQKVGKLNDLEMESLYGCKGYLEFYSKKYKLEIDIDENVLKALENNCEYICQCCDEKIEGFSCKSGHVNMFCMLTLTPILSDDYLVCKSCSLVARTDLDLAFPVCVFCDLHLIKPD